jgi:histidine triad (HIT) family protein
LNIPESDTIARYLLHQFPHHGPSFQPNHVVSNIVCRLHDVYITPIQGCLYKALPPFGTFGTRSHALQELYQQWQILEQYIPKHDDDATTNNNEDGIYLFGKDITLADATLFPTAVFMDYMYPKFHSSLVGGRESVASSLSSSSLSSSLPPKIQSWCLRVKTNDIVFAKVYDEIMAVIDHVLDQQRQRWNTILGAGIVDNLPSTIFDRIISKDISANIVYEDDDVIAFHDIQPVAPVHCVVTPKQRHNLSSLRSSSYEHNEILGKLLVVAGQIARDTSLGFGTSNGARYVINDGINGGQEISHLHIHVLGGRPFLWPPG